MAVTRFGTAMVYMLLAVLLLSCCGGKDAGEEDVPVYLAAVTAGDTSGSGIIYGMDDEWLYVLMASHVLGGEEIAGGRAVFGPPEEGADPVTVRFCDDWEAACTDIVVSETADLAVIRIPMDQIPAAGRKLYRCVETDKECFDALEAGDDCTAVGIGPGRQAVCRRGSILEPWIYMEDYGQYMIWARADIQAGMSGGGLFDGRGHFIGILSGGNRDGELAAVPLSLILQFEAETDGDFRKLLDKAY